MGRLRDTKAPPSISFVATGGGKLVALCQEIHEVCLRHPGTRVAFVGESCSVALALKGEIAAGNLKADPNESGIFCYQNGSEIVCLGTKAESEMRGFRFAIEQLG